MKKEEYIKCIICGKFFKNINTHMFWKHPNKEQLKIVEKERKKRSERQRGNKNIAKREDVRLKLSEKAKQRTGKYNNCWKGNDASYICKHKYMRKIIKIDDICFICNKKIKNDDKIELMNLDHKYDRNKKELWKWAHVSCHRYYDKTYNDYQKNKERDELGRFKKINEYNYRIIHKHIEKNKEKPLFCEICGEEKKLELSNKDHRYSMNVEEWLYLCKLCHMKNDKKSKHLNIILN